VNRQPPSRTRLRFSTIAAVYGPALVVLGFTILVSASADVPVAVFLRDPADTLHAHPLTGLLSHVGVLVWWAAASVCLFCGAVLWRARADQRLRSFLAWSGVITAVLATDDLFLVHDALAPLYLGLDDKAFLFAYGAAVAWYLVRFRTIILDSEYTLLLLALLFFGSSILVDMVLQDRWASPWRIAVEDGLKLLGIVGWSGYLILAAARALAASSAAPRPTASIP
jgi:hypothetical protein